MNRMRADGNTERSGFPKDPAAGHSPVFIGVNPRHLRILSPLFGFGGAAAFVALDGVGAALCGFPQCSKAPER